MTEDWQADVPRLLLETGYWSLKAGSLAQARTLLQGAEALRPQDPTPKMFLGMVSFAERRFADAERAYRGVLDGHADHDLTRAFLGEALIAQKRWPDAQAVLESVVEANRHEAAVAFASELLGQLKSGLFQRAGSGSK
jgi:Flp pilus assembly protein TadD